MRTKIPYLGFACTLSMAACLPPAGDLVSDRNKDGILDTAAGSVRGVDTVTQLAPSSPTVVIFASIHNGLTGQPIENVRVEIVTGKNQTLQAFSDAAGGLMVEGVARGQLRMNIKQDGFAPVSDVFTAQQLQAATVDDNYTVYMGRIYLLPTDTTWHLTARTEDGDPVANQLIYVEVPSAYIDSRTNVADGGPQAVGLRTMAVTTNPQGVAEVPGMFDVRKLYDLDCSNGSIGNGIALRTVSPSYDVDADGTTDFCGATQTFYTCDLAAYQNDLRLTPFARQNNPNLAIVGSNLTSASLSSWTPDRAGSTPTEATIGLPLSANEPVVMIFNRPVDLATAEFALINDFPNARNNDILDNSTPRRPGQAFPIDPYDAIVKPANGMPTMTLTIDPSETVVTATPTTAPAAGHVYYLVGSIGAKETHNGGHTGGLTFAPSQIDNQTNGTVGIYVAQPDPLKIENVYLESVNPATGTGGFHRVIIGFNQPVRGYNAAASLGGGGLTEPHILVCFDEDLQGNGFASGPQGALDEFECPQAGHKLVTERDIGPGKGLVPANIKPGSSPLRKGMARYWEFQVTGPLIGRPGGKLKVIFPKTDGAPYQVGNIATDVNGSAFATGLVVDGTFTIGANPASSSNVKFDFATNPTLSLQ